MHKSDVGQVWPHSTRASGKRQYSIFWDADIFVEISENRDP